MISNFKNMELLNEFEVSNLLNIPLHRLNTWEKNGKLIPVKLNGVKRVKNLTCAKVIHEMFE